MGMKHFKAYTPSRRNMTVSTYEEVTKTTPEKSLLTPKKKNDFSNNFSLFMFLSKQLNIIISYSYAILI